jgi:hypothetical protein
MRVGLHRQRPPDPPDLGAGDTAVFRGTVRLGFEQVEFVECGSEERWWVEPARSAVGHELVRGVKIVSTTTDRGAAAVEFRGRPSPRGRYGHMNRYDREFVLDEVVTVRDTTRTTCAASLEVP